MNYFLVFALGSLTLLWALVISIWIVREQENVVSRVPIAIFWILAAATLVPVVADLQFRRGWSLEPQSAVVMLDQFLRFVLVLLTCIAIATRLHQKLNAIFGTLAALWGFAAISTLLNGQSNTSVWISILFALALALNSPDIGILLQHGRIILRTYILINLSVILFLPESVWLTSNERYWAGIPQFIGLASHPNGLGAIAALAVVIEAFGRMGGRFRWLFGSMATFLLLASQSRTGWLMAVIGLIGLVAVEPKSGRIRKSAIWAGTFIILLGLLLIFNADLGGLNGLSSGRVRGWQIMSSLSPETWLYGGGLEVLSEALNNNRLMGLGSWSAQAHNQFLQTFLDSGVPGLLILLTLYVVTAKQALNSIEPVKSLKIALLGMFIVSSLTETPVRPSLGETSIYIIFCLLIISSTGPRHSASRTTPISNLDFSVQPMHKAFG